MTRLSPLIWLALILLILVPSTASRFLLDLAGGLMVTLVALPIVLGGIGWIGWKVIQSKLITCEVCGISTTSQSNQCPVCGATISKKNSSPKSDPNISIPASSATIDITADEAE